MSLKCDSFDDKFIDDANNIKNNIITLINFVIIVLHQLLQLNLALFKF